MKYLCLIPVAALAAAITGCDSGPRPPAVHYVDPNRPVASSMWGPTDLKMATDDIYTQLSMHCAMKQQGQVPRVMLSRIQNRTNEIIDTLLIGQTIMSAMSTSDKFVLIDAQAREDIAAEYNYQQSGYVDPTKAKGPGHQEAAEYMLRGELCGMDVPKGWSDVKYYKLVMRLTDIESGTTKQWESQIQKVINR